MAEGREQTQGEWPIVVERGERPCVECGKPHDCLRTREMHNENRWGSWADPEDGHYYKPESWESLGRKWLARA